MRIQPSRGLGFPDLRGLRHYRELLYFLALRDVKVRYKQTVLGVAWAVLQPLLTMVVFAIFFGELAGVPSDGLPYPLFAYAALVPWTFFANSLSHSATSLVTSSNLVTKVYFPRLIIPVASMGAALLDFAIASLVLVGMMAYYGVPPTTAMLWLPAFLLLLGLNAAAFGIWFSALNVQFRDVRYVVPFLLQLWLFVSPVAYATSLVPESWSALYAVNPMVAVIDGFRWALLGSDRIAATQLTVSTLASLAVLIGGLVYFSRMERTFADVV